VYGPSRDQTDVSLAVIARQAAESRHSGLCVLLLANSYFLLIFNDSRQTNLIIFWTDLRQILQRWQNWIGL